MASVKYGSLVTEIIGSVGGQTFQRSRNGFSVRNKPRPRNTRTLYTNQARYITAVVSATWATLSDVQRASWDAVAPNWPAVDHFGDPVILSGYNTFVRSNIGLIYADGAPATSGLNPSSVSPLLDPAIAIAEGAGTASLTWLGGAVPADTTVLLWLSQPVSAGRAFNRSQLRIAGRLLATTSSPVPFAPELVKRMGVFPPPGARVWAAVQSVSALAGNMGMIQPVSCIVTA